MAGRKPIIDNLEQLKNLMRFKPSLEETAAFFDCGERTVQETIRREYDLTFQEFRMKHLGALRNELITAAIDKALDGDGPMLRFCIENLADEWGKRHVVGVEDAPPPPGPTTDPIDLDERRKQLKGDK
jgi:hypothetical protein